MVETGTKILWAGAAILVLGAGVAVLLPGIPFLQLANDTRQDLAVVLELVTRLANVVLVPLGAALIGAAVVLRAMGGARDTAAPTDRH